MKKLLLIALLSISYSGFFDSIKSLYQSYDEQIVGKWNMVVGTEETNAVAGTFIINNNNTLLHINLVNGKTGMKNWAINGNLWIITHNYQFNDPSIIEDVLVDNYRTKQNTTIWKFEFSDYNKILLTTVGEEQLGFLYLERIEED